MKKFLIEALILLDCDNFVMDFVKMESKSILHRIDKKYYMIDTKNKKMVKVIMEAYSKRNNLGIIILKTTKIKSKTYINLSTVKVMDVIKLTDDQS